MLAMRPPEFWRSTPRDIDDLARGYRWRDRREWERTAWLAGSIAGLQHARRIPAVAKMLAFLGPEDGRAAKRRDAETPEQARAFVAKLAREHKKKAWAFLGDEFSEGGKD